MIETTIDVRWIHVTVCLYPWTCVEGRATPSSSHPCGTKGLLRPGYPPTNAPQTYLLIPGSLLNSLITVAMTTRLSSEPKMEGVWLMSRAGVR